MFRNYLLVALRNLGRYRAYTFLNLMGLITGLVACLLIMLWVHDERTYDRQFSDVERLYRVNVAVGDRPIFALTSWPYGPTLAREVAGVEKSVRVWQTAGVLLGQGDLRIQESASFFADSAFLSLFDFPVLVGEPQTALAAPFTMVLTESLAKRLFNRIDVVGERVRVDNQDDYTVTAVVADPPTNTHVQFQLLRSMATFYAQAQQQGFDPETQWMSFTNQSTYVRLTPGTAPSDVAAQFPAMFERHMGDLIERMGLKIAAELQPVTAIHLHPVAEELTPGGNRAYVIIFTLIALFILGIACINFMNLATARATRRAREVGVRKVAGAYRGQLIGQFLSESLLLTLAALAVALGTAELLLPAFNNLTGKALSLAFVGTPWGLLLLLVFGLAVGLLAGLYPAFVLSGFRPTEVLKGSGQAARVATGTQVVTLRQGLVVTQFALSAGLIICTLMVYQQLNYLQNSQLGFQKEHVLTLNLPGDSTVQRHLESFRTAFTQHPMVLGATTASVVPSLNENYNPVAKEGAAPDDSQIMYVVQSDPHYLQTLGLELSAGRNFSEEIPSDQTDAFLINESAAKVLGLDNPVGERLEWRGGPDARTGTIVGVVKDYHFRSLHATITPALFFLNAQRANFLVVRLRPGYPAEALHDLERAWKSRLPDWPFNYQFLDESFGRQYQAEERLARLFTVFAGLAIFVACLGLFGLAAYTTEQRTKEIGVRKVLGATIPQILGLLSREYAMLLGVAFVIAAPVAGYLMRSWMTNFAYHIGFSAWPYLFAVGLVLSIALLTVSVQSLRAALANPVRSLRSE
ncbi:putative ABC transport system permease protein [Catalinimonas alkaloidigena]|uniref:Putative ABC transport system permease protein n=1 Tax=Catalinimonas alkaloidigena TaxID=1075417 RepID=A0A1G9UFZ6_9BACT|nr:ABC transporter permease [Catalinimonas alkaloidigena]SDM58880.1 putative ABC transport system permease protein [Catalinimonas alkaloidigena]